MSRGLRWSMTILGLLLLVLLAACGGAGAAAPDEPAGPPEPRPVEPAEPVEPPAPQPPAPDEPIGPPASGGGLIQDPAYVDETELLIRESYPLQVALLVRGNKPTPCHELAWEVEGPDEAGRIEVSLYTLTAPDRVCIQVLEPFEVTIELGEYAGGHYTVLLNGQVVGEFDG